MAEIETSVVQVNIMPTGRKKKRSVVEASSVALLALIRKGFFI